MTFKQERQNGRYRQRAASKLRRARELLFTAAGLLEASGNRFYPMACNATAVAQVAESVHRLAKALKGGAA